MGRTQQNGGEETDGGEGQVDQGSISITFGRFNPPTIGHKKLLDRVAREAKTSGGEYRIYPSRSEDPKKNPLDAGTKIKFMRQAYPDHANSIVDSSDMRTILMFSPPSIMTGIVQLVLLWVATGLASLIHSHKNTTETYTHSTKSKW